MNEQLKMVREFHDAFSYDQAEHNSDELVLLSGKVAYARMAFITEELSEILLNMASGNREMQLDGAVDLSYFALGTLAILGRDIEEPVGGYFYGVDTCNVETGCLQDLINSVTAVLQGLLDYTNVAACHQLPKFLTEVHFQCLRFAQDVIKADFHGAFAEVQRSNMSKLDTDGRPLYNDAGKILKGPKFSQPKLAPFLLEDD